MCQICKFKYSLSLRWNWYYIVIDEVYKFYDTGVYPDDTDW